MMARYPIIGSIIWLVLTMSCISNKHRSESDEGCLDKLLQEEFTASVKKLAVSDRDSLEKTFRKADRLKKWMILKSLLRTGHLDALPPDIIADFIVDGRAVSKDDFLRIMQEASPELRESLMCHIGIFRLIGEYIDTHGESAWALCSGPTRSDFQSFILALPEKYRVQGLLSSLPLVGETRDLVFRGELTPGYHSAAEFCTEELIDRITTVYAEEWNLHNAARVLKMEETAVKLQLSAILRDGDVRAKILPSIGEETKLLYQVKALIFLVSSQSADPYYHRVLKVTESVYEEVQGLDENESWSSVFIVGMKEPIRAEMFACLWALSRLSKFKENAISILREFWEVARENGDAALAAYAWFVLWSKSGWNETVSSMLTDALDSSEWDVLFQCIEMLMMHYEGSQLETQVKDEVGKRVKRLLKYFMSERRELDDTSKKSNNK